MAAKAVASWVRCCRKIPVLALFATKKGPALPKLISLSAQTICQRTQFPAAWAAFRSRIHVNPRSSAVKYGKIVVNEENDGWAFERRGPERSEQFTTLKDLKGTDLYNQAVDGLKGSIPKRYRVIKTESKEYDIREHLEPHELERYAELSSKLDGLRESVKKRLFGKKKMK
jgi:hypothetical protein